jgi:group I intron endonuclease
MVGIYKITNPKGKIYIGQSKNINNRFDSYKKLYHCSQQRKLYNSLKKYGPENHKFEIIKECNIQDLNKFEIEYILYYNTVNDGLNLTFGGEGGARGEEIEELRRINSMKPILQYDLKGYFIKEYKGAPEAIKEIGKGNPNNINDCARGKYKSAYGYQWLYKNGSILSQIPPYKVKKTGSKWTNERRIKTINSRKNEKRSEEYSKKISKLKEKPIYQYDLRGDLICIFPSFQSFNGSKIIGTSKLRKILNKNIYYKGFKYFNSKINE